MRRILLTGAGPNGFVGRNIKEALSSRYELFTPGRAELDLSNFDDLSRYVESNRINFVINSAVHNPKPGENNIELEIDLRMYYNFAKLKDRFDKIIYFGSGAEYDKRFPIKMVTEEEIGRSIPETAYGFAKYIMNDHARSSDKIYNLRLFGIYGKYELWPVKFISNLCCKAVFGLPLTIRQNCKFDFLYINDLPAIVDWFICNEPSYHDYNICYGEPVELTYLAQIVREVSGEDIEIKVFKEGYNLEYTASNYRLKNDIPGLKLTDFHSAITELYKYYYDNKDKIDFNILKESK